MPHHVNQDGNWFHLHYQGEEADDGCANELSLYQLPTDRLEMVLTNVDFANVSHDNTLTLTPTDAQQLIIYLQGWLNQTNKTP